MKLNSQKRKVAEQNTTEKIETVPPTKTKTQDNQDDCSA
jgi:hypothetical protein